MLFLLQAFIANGLVSSGGMKRERVLQKWRDMMDE